MVLACCSNAYALVWGLISSHALGYRLALLFSCRYCICVAEQFLMNELNANRTPTHNMEYEVWIYRDKNALKKFPYLIYVQRSCHRANANFIFMQKNMLQIWYAAQSSMKMWFRTTHTCLFLDKWNCMISHFSRSTCFKYQHQFMQEDLSSGGEPISFTNRFFFPARVSLLKKRERKMKSSFNNGL